MWRLRVWIRYTFQVYRRVRVLNWCQAPVVESLEWRLCLSTSGYAIATLTQQPPSTDPTYYVADNLVPGAAVLESSGPAYTIASGSLAPGDPQPLTYTPGKPSALHIVLEEGPHLRANHAAQAAFATAVKYLESIFVNPITIVVDAEIAPLPSNIIGETSSVEYHIDSSQYDSVRDLMVNAATGSETVDYGLPTSSQFNAIVPPGNSNPFTVGGLTVTRANLLALGVPASVLQSGPASAYNPHVKLDMSMLFNSKFPFDYSQANGISAGLIDFTGVVEHEIAHGMGFDSEVDSVDYDLNHPSLSRVLYPTTMDLFRLLPGDGAADFSNSPRVLVPGDIEPNQVFYDGGDFDPSGIAIPGLTVGDIPLSTGQFNGDGSQASHWLEGNDFGFDIGALNPTASYGHPVLWTSNDTRVLGLIGWEVAAQSSIQGTVYVDVNHTGRLSSNDPTVAGARVYLDENRDGIYEPWEPSVTTDGLGVYRFFDLTADDYIVRVVPFSGYSAETGSTPFSNVPIGLGQSAAHADFAMAAASVPSPFSTVDIGPVSASGTDSDLNGTFTMTSGGGDVWGISDACHYLYETLTGDCTITARLDSFDAASPWAKAGIMIRRDNWKASANVFLAQTHGHGTQLLARSVAGAHTNAVVNPAVTLPWLKMVRKGDTFTSFASADDIHWVETGTEHVHLGKAVTVGLAVTANDPAIPATAVFSDVQITGDSS